MKLNSLTLVSLGIVGALAMTNPTQDLYVRTITAELVKQAPELVCSQLETFHSEQTATMIEPLIAVCKRTGKYSAFLLRDKLEDFVQSQTNRQNLVIGSLYTTYLPGKTIKTIGILNNFVPYTVD